MAVRAVGLRVPLSCAFGRGVAQPGSASAWGAGGRGFESRRPDQWQKSGPCGPFLSLILVRMRTGAFARRRRSTAEPWMAERTSRASARDGPKGERREGASHPAAPTKFLRSSMIAGQPQGASFWFLAISKTRTAIHDGLGRAGGNPPSGSSFGGIRCAAPALPRLLGFPDEAGSARPAKAARHSDAARRCAGRSEAQHGFACLDLHAPAKLRSGSIQQSRAHGSRNFRELFAQPLRLFFGC